MNMKNLIRSEKAASEALSFLMMLGILLASGAGIFIAGKPLIESSQRSIHFLEMDQSFMLLAQNLDKVGYDRGPVRVTELKEKGGTISVVQSSMMTVDGIPFSMGSLEYTYENKTVAYENGGIWTKYPNGAVIVTGKPRITIGNVTTIPVIELMGDDSIGGEGLFRVSAKSYSSTIFPILPSGSTVRLSIKSNYYSGWADYLSEEGAVISIDDANQTVNANITANTVNVYRNQVLVNIL
ncbi:MAG: hypothetical protein C3F06_04740 [Candidatus Methanoperedenaceae archaeon]|nr:MAG: hypothetical protein C3F06_04740 [Candidatus Methanoperedenaceae archaeon]